MDENERRSGQQPANRMLGRVIACDGAHATIAAETEIGSTDVAQLWSVGRLISIEMGTSRVAALVYAMRTGEEHWSSDKPNRLLIDVELVGEVYRTEDGSERFPPAFPVTPTRARSRIASARETFPRSMTAASETHASLAS